MELRYLSMSKKSNILSKQIKNETRCIISFALENPMGLTRPRLVETWS